ncbi:lysozyme inhibitor LprI family protein [Erythrobacter westpacificensis]|uniref:Lysozyme inhibitor LprI family protein n=1 Tax=Erythrobacter westpacificensis TaxID=1055231 RepID=A0ABP9KB05_9SPHN
MTIAHLLLPLLLQAGLEVDAAQYTPDCAEPQTQRAMNHCAALEWDEADAALNAQWQETAARMRRMDRATTPDDGRPGYFSQLLRGQRAWLVYRDHHCASVGYNARGGSLEPLLVSTCKTELTRERTGQLEDLAEWPQ